MPGTQAHRLARRANHGSNEPGFFHRVTGGSRLGLVACDERLCLRQYRTVVITRAGERNQFFDSRLSLCLCRRALERPLQHLHKLLKRLRSFAKVASNAASASFGHGALK